MPGGKPSATAPYSGTFCQELAGTDFAEQRKAKGNFLAEILLVAMRLWVTPVLIPNTMVKT